jgi:hypothetical protein
MALLFVGSLGCAAAVRTAPPAAGPAAAAAPAPAPVAATLPPPITAIRPSWAGCTGTRPGPDRLVYTCGPLSILVADSRDMAPAAMRDGHLGAMRAHLGRDQLRSSVHQRLIDGRAHPATRITSEFRAPEGTLSITDEVVVIPGPSGGARLISCAGPTAVHDLQRCTDLGDDIARNGPPTEIRVKHQGPATLPFLNRTLLLPDGCDHGTPSPGGTSGQVRCAGSNLTWVTVAADRPLARVVKEIVTELRAKAGGPLEQRAVACRMMGSPAQCLLLISRGPGSSLTVLAGGEVEGVRVVVGCEATLQTALRIDRVKEIPPVCATVLGLDR